MLPEEPSKLPEIPPTALVDLHAICRLMDVDDEFVRRLFQSGKLKGSWWGRRRGWVTSGRMLLELIESGGFLVERKEAEP